MPVRYDIAAGVPQQQSGGFDPINMMAQLQAMDYRQQQNALARMQMQEYQRKLQAEQALRGLSTGAGFNIADPSLVGRTFAIDPDQAVKIANLQRQLEAMQASTEAQRAAAGEASARTQLARREFEEIKLPRAGIEAEKLGLEKQKLGAEITREERAGKKLEFEINKEALDRDAKTLEKLENVGAKVFNTNGKGYDQFRQMAIKEHPEFENMLPATYDADTLSGFIDNAANTREKLKMASEYEYREITDATGATRVVAIPKRSPRAGAIEIPGAAGAKPADFGFMPGPPDTGLVTRTNPRTGEAALITPSQPGANVMAAPAAPANAMVAPPQATPAAAPAQGRLIPSEIRPTAEAPVGSAAYNNKRFATEVLDAAGFNAETGKDEVSELIRKSTSGGMEAGAAGIRGFFGGASPGMENIAKLETIKNDVVLKKLGGKLGAGISEGDRQFIEKLMGDIANPSIPANQRLAAWAQIRSLMVKYANAGQPTPAPAGAPAGRPSLDEIFK